MTQHPFNRDYSEQEVQKLDAESTAPVNDDELTDEESEDVAGGSIPLTSPRLEQGTDPSPISPIKPITDGKL